VVVSDAVLEKAIGRAVGEELRRVREAKDWSRGDLVKRLPSGIGARTILSYEHGTRHLALLRFVEVCRAMEVDPSHVLSLALQRAKIHLDRLVLWVDLKALVTDKTTKFVSMIIWAHNKLIEHPGGIVEIAPDGVRELATMISATHEDLAGYLAGFTPDLSQIPEIDEGRMIVL
jgi:transcriptional regulator with XRE-family HTH domain